MTAALAPVRAALLARARADARALRAAARADARQSLAGARERAGALLAAARAEGAEQGAALCRAERSRSSRAGRELLLTARRAAYDELIDRSRAAVRELLADPAVQARVEQLARDRLGTDADVRPHPDGGSVAEAPDGRRLDLSVRALVDAVVPGLDLEPLWAG